MYYYLKAALFLLFFHVATWGQSPEAEPIETEPATPMAEPAPSVQPAEQPIQQPAEPVQPAEPAKATESDPPPAEPVNPPLPAEPTEEAKESAEPEPKEEPEVVYAPQEPVLDYDMIKDDTDEYWDQLELQPNLVEVTMVLDPKTYGVKAREHQYFAGVTLDPFVLGAFGVQGYTHLKDEWGLVGMLDGYYSGFSGLHQLKLLNPELVSDFAIELGALAKRGITEWVYKSRIFASAGLALGYRSQDLLLGNRFDRLQQSFYIKPVLGLGIEKVYDFGLRLSFELLAHYPIYISQMTYLTYLAFAPRFGVSFVW